MNKNTTFNFDAAEEPTDAEVATEVATEVAADFDAAEEPTDAEVATEVAADKEEL